MRITVEAWAPDYGGEVDLRGPDDLTVERVDTACESRPWNPIAPAAEGEFSSRPVGFVDGTRRVDARLFLSDNGSAPIPGVAGSVGVGAVVCDSAGPGANGRKGPEWWARRRAEITELRLIRFLATGGGQRAAISAGPGLEYQSLPVNGLSVDEMVSAVHNQMRAREAELAQDLAQRDDALVFIDGPLAVMRPGATTVVGFIKAHHARYLEGDEEALLGRLGCGERTPLFAFGEPRPRYSWYLRLCGRDADLHAWHGLVRCETPVQVGLDRAVSLADASAAILPAFASLPHWDARAPQNLVPVAGLEKRLRHLLGDRELVYRMIRSAAQRYNGEGKEVG